MSSSSSSLLAPVEDALLPVVEAVISKVPALSKVESFLAANPWVTKEGGDDIRLVADLVEGKTSAIEGDVQVALSDAPVPAPYNLLVQSPAVANLLAGMAISHLVAKHAAAAAPANSDPPAPGVEIAHIGQDTGGQVVAG